MGRFSEPTVYYELIPIGMIASFMAESLPLDAVLTLHGVCIGCEKLQRRFSYPAALVSSSLRTSAGFDSGLPSMIGGTGVSAVSVGRRLCQSVACW